METAIPYLRAIGMTFLFAGFVTAFLFPFYDIHTLLFVIGGICFIITFVYWVVSVIRWYLGRE